MNIYKAKGALVSACDGAWGAPYKKKHGFVADTATIDSSFSRQLTRKTQICGNSHVSGNVYFMNAGKVTDSLLVGPEDATKGSVKIVGLPPNLGISKISGLRAEGNVQITNMQELSGNWWIHQDPAQINGITIVSGPVLQGSGEIHNSSVSFSGIINNGLFYNSNFNGNTVDNIGMLKVLNSGVYFSTIKGNFVAENSTFQGIAEGDNAIYNSSINPADFSGNIIARNMNYLGYYNGEAVPLILRGCSSVNNVQFAALPPSYTIHATDAYCGWKRSYEDDLGNRYFYVNNVPGAPYGCVQMNITK